MQRFSVGPAEKLAMAIMAMQQEQRAKLTAEGAKFFRAAAGALPPPGGDDFYKKNLNNMSKISKIIKTYSDRTMNYLKSNNLNLNNFKKYLQSNSQKLLTFDCLSCIIYYVHLFFEK